MSLGAKRSVSRQNGYPAAVIGGVFEERSGCLFVASGGERWLLLWPEGYAATVKRGRLEVMNDDGRIIARDGDRVSFAGGETRPIEVGGPTEADRWARDLTGSDLPGRCGHLYWLVAPS